MIRAELIHPMSVHFPIVFIVSMLVIKFLLFLVHDEKKIIQIQNLYFALIVMSLVSTFISIYLGDMAFDLIRSGVCKIGLVDRHEDFSKVLVWLLGAILFFETIYLILKEKVKNLTWYKIKELIILILLFFVGNSLYQTAHSGAALVYEQGAAVLNHPKNCQ